MVGADLANLVNEAALLAARNDHDRVTMAASPTPWRRSSWAPSAASCSHPRSGNGPPTTSPATPCSACSPPARIQSARSPSSPRPVPRRHLPGPSERAVRLLHRLPARPHHRRSGRARRRGGYLWRRDHRRRKRPGPRQPDRAADSGPLGDVPGRRAGHGTPPALPGMALWHRRLSPRPPGSWSTPKPAGSSRNATSRRSKPCAATGTGWTGWCTPSSRRKPWTRTRSTPRPASAATPPPPRSPAAREG